MTAIYASQSDVEPLVKFISDEASTDLYNQVLANADSWVNARLLSNRLSIWELEITTVETEVEDEVDNLLEDPSEDVSEDPSEDVSEEPTTTETVTVIPDKPIPALLKTAAVYYAASDIILALYNGEEMPTQYDTYFNKAETMITAYITQMQTELADTDLKKFNPVKHSKSKSYYQRKRRRPRA